MTISGKSIWEYIRDPKPIAIESPVFVPPSNPKIPILYVEPIDNRIGSSLAVESIQYHTLLSLLNYSHTLVEKKEPSFSPSGSLPCLQLEDGRLIAGYELEKHINTCSKIDPSQSADSTALCSLIQSKLGFALSYELYYLSDGFQSIIAPHRGQSLSWPLSLLVPYLERQKKIQWLQSVKPILDSEEIYHDAGTVLNDMANLLGGNAFLLGNEPTPADAVLFAHLHLIMAKLSTTSQLHLFLMDHDNLIQYTKRIWNRMNPKKT